MSDVERAAREIFGARAASYVNSAAHTDRQVLDRVVELARPCADALVLDVATGTGHTAFALAPHVSHIVAVDITPEMLAEARRLRDSRRVANVSFHLASANDLPFLAESFDVVTCRRAAHHFADIWRSLEEMRRVLKTNGRLVIDDRSVPEDDFVDVTMNRLDTLHDRSHVRQYRPSEWSRMLSQCGFSVEVIEPYTRHRPLSSLTDNASPEDAAEIRAIVASLDERQRVALNVAEIDGVVYTNHWYVMVAAAK